MEQQQYNLANRLKAVWRFKWIIILMMLVAGVTVFALSAILPPPYQATATVMVESTGTNLALPAEYEFAALQAIGSQIELMRSRSVLERAISELDPEKSINSQYMQLELNRLQNSLKIEQIRGTSLIALTVSSSDPLVAQKQANAVAEAYVYEANRARLAAIETALEKTTKQLQEVTGSKLDISISPSLTRLTTRIDITLVNLEEASSHLKQIESQDGTDPPALNMIIIQRINDVTYEANQLYELVEEDLNSASLPEIESQIRVLAIKLDTLSAQVNAIRGMETDPQIYGKLLDVQELIQVASSSTDAVLQQVIALETTSNPTDGVSQLRQGLPSRIREHTNLVITSLEEATEQLQQLANLIWQQLEMLDERLTLATADLQALSQQLQPNAPEQRVLLTHAELASMETHARTVVASLALLASALENIQLAELDPQVYRELLNADESSSLAYDTAMEIPSEIAGIAASGGGRLSYTTLDNLRQELQLALLTSGSAIRIVDMAVASTSATDIFSHFRNVLMAMVAALFLGILSVMVVQNFDRRVQDISQVTSDFGLPVLAQFAVMPITNSLIPSVLNKDTPEYLEAFRMLRTNLGLDSYNGWILLVSSPEEKEGKTTIAANLARVVALQGRRVLLIDGDARKPDIAAAFGLTEEEDLPEFLTSENEPMNYIAQADGIDILASRTTSAESVEILSSPRMKELLQKARQTYDIVIVDSAPVMGYADTRVLAREVDAVLLVLQPNVSKFNLVKKSREALEILGAQVVGFVLNKV